MRKLHANFRKQKLSGIEMKKIRARQKKKPKIAQKEDPNSPRKGKQEHSKKPYCKNHRKTAKKEGATIKTSYPKR